MTRILRFSSFAVFCVCVALMVWVSTALFALQLDESQLKATAQREHGAQGVNNLEKWLDTLATMQGAPEEQQLEVINRFWNQIAVAGEDIDIWGVERSEEHTSELQSRGHLVCSLLLEQKARAYTDKEHPRYG